MATAQLQVARLLSKVVANGATGDKFLTTGTLAALINTERIESVIISGTASGETKPVYELHWAGGVTTTEIMGTPTNDPLGDQFEPFIDATYPTEAILVNTGVSPNEQNSNWIAAPMPLILWPYVRFQVKVLAGSPTDSTISLYALIRRQFGS